MSRVAALLAELEAGGRTLAIAESLTGGLLIDAFVQVPGASRVLRGGIVAYATPFKHQLLGVDAGLLAREGPVHAEVARQMAKGVRTAFDLGGERAEVGVATTGVAGPAAQDGNPPGLVFVAAAVGRHSAVRSAQFAGDRAQIRAQAVSLAIDLLAELLERASAVRGDEALETVTE